MPFHMGKFGWRDHEQTGGRVAVRAFLMTATQALTPGLWPHIRPWGKTAWRGCSSTGFAETVEIIHDYYCFKPLSFGVIWYTAVKTTETAGDREVRRAWEGSCRSSLVVLHVPRPTKLILASVLCSCLTWNYSPSQHTQPRPPSSGQAPPPTSTRPQWSLSSLSLKDILNVNYIPSRSLLTLDS